MSFESGTTDAREARIIALQSEINELCRRHGEAEQIRLPTRRNHRLQPPAAHSPKMPCAREAFNRSIIESSVNCIKGLDLEGNLLAMLNGQRILGIDCIEQFLNTSWFDFWKGGDRQAAQAAVNAAAELEMTLTLYLTTYNQHIPQRALHHQTPIQALQKWRTEKPDLFVKRVYKQAGLDNGSIIAPGSNLFQV